MKKVWITGGGSGIGAALAVSFANDGWSVSISGRDANKLSVLAEKSSRIRAIPCDITDKEAVTACADAAGPIDLAILNAGTYTPGSTAEAPMSAFRAAMEVNYFGTLNCLHAILPGMRRHGGRIAVVASLAGCRGLPRASGYGPSKAALISLCESLRAELDGSNVTLQLVNPGFVQSDLTDKNEFPMPYLMSAADAAKAIRAGLVSDRFEIAFPTPFVRRMRLMRMLPYRLFFPLIRKVTGA